MLSNGQKVLQEKITTENNQFHVNTSNLQSGIYFVEIGNARMKFVVE
ncbi:MAG: T9SS type A sorting domain-containing protein [Crocinitomicaceae bacterium]|nr:MAG: T9SS type A sorting domain-containing protein [Crocinitomicaceae bacterium]